MFDNDVKLVLKFTSLALFKSSSLRRIMNSTVEQKYEEIKANLINEYGEPKTEMIMGRKHIVINEYLNAFNQFVNVLTESLQKLNISFESFAEEFNYAMDYCKDAEYREVYYLAKLLKKSSNYNLKKALSNLKIANFKQLPTRKVYNCIVSAFNITKNVYLIYCPLS